MIDVYFKKDEKSAEFNGIIYQIRAKVDIPEFGVKKGELGGWISQNLYVKLIDNDNARLLSGDLIFWVDSSSKFYIKDTIISLIDFSNSKEILIKNNSKVILEFESSNQFSENLYISNSIIKGRVYLGSKFLFIRGVEIDADSRDKRVGFSGENITIQSYSFSDRLYINPAKIFDINNYIGSNINIVGYVNMKCSGTIRSNNLLIIGIIESPVKIESENLQLSNRIHLQNTVIINSTINMVDVFIVQCIIENSTFTATNGCNLFFSKFIGDIKLLGNKDKLDYNMLMLNKCFAKDLKVICTTESFEASSPDEDDKIELVGLIIINGIVKYQKKNEI